MRKLITYVVVYAAIYLMASFLVGSFDVSIVFDSLPKRGIVLVFGITIIYAIELFDFDLRDCHSEY